MLDPRTLTRSQVEAIYREEIASIRSTEEHPQATSMAMNEARRWLDNALSLCQPDAATLGDKLRANIAEAERQRLSREERENRAARERHERHRRQVTLAIDALKSRITSAIEEGSIPGPIRLPRSLDNDTSRWNTPITSPAHCDHGQWQEEMVSWARHHGLVLDAVSDHDGGGMESWWNLTVRPE